MGDIVYPQGCRPLTEDLGPDELIRRLKTLTHTLQGMGQDDGLYQQYIPLALHLADDYFLTHPSKDVQLLVACCIADVLRVYAPEAPYKDQDQIKTIFMFLIKQLNGLKDPKDPAFKRYFYLLENLAYVKSFNMCFEIEDSQEIFCNLFSLFFKIVNDEHSAKVKNFMLDVLCPLITESDNVSQELLDIILINIVEPNKTQKKNAYQLARELIIKTSDTLESYVKIFFNEVLIVDKPEKVFSITQKLYDLIYELYVICPKILCSVLPQLECKLKSSSETERLKAVSLLARMFSEKNSTLSKKYPTLWRQFLGRFYDIGVPIRIKCVQSTMHFLLNHPNLRKDVIDALKVRQHDSDETVRYEVVMAIVETAKRDFQIVSESEDLLEFVKERTLDKKFKIRKEAMYGLALIYKKYLNDSNVPDATKKAINWIKDKILHGYYMTGIEDRLLVERLLITCLVPYQLPSEERMKKLYQLLGTIDENAMKAFIELQKNQLKVRKHVSDWVKLHWIRDITPKLQKEMNAKCALISKQLPEPIKALEYLNKFSTNMRKEPILLRGMETILKRDVTCKECADTMSSVLKRLGQPIMTNLYYNTVKMLLERIASVMVDKDSIEILVGLIEDCLRGGAVIEEVGLPRETAGERGLNLLCVLAYVFSAHFQHETILRHMIALLSFDDEHVAPYILKAFTHLGRYKRLSETHPKILDELLPICKDFALIGTPKQAKHAIRCIYVNTQNSDDEPCHEIFHEIIDTFKTTLISTNPNYRTAIVCLGHIAYNLPQKFLTQIKNLIARKIVKELLIKDVPENRNDLPDGNWCNENELPDETRCKIEALKTMARWLLGLKNDVLSAQKTFRMLNAFIKQNGDLLEQGRLSLAEMSWLRLAAGKAMLKICEQKGVGDQFTAEQFFNLSTLMIDPVPEVREIFAKKLHKGLNKGLPQKCLPLDFMGYYVLGGRETDQRLHNLLKTYIETDIIRRREYVKSYATANLLVVEKAMSQLPHILPDYMLVFAIPVLTHDSNFTNYEDRTQLKQIEKCLWFILEPLMSNKEFFCLGFYRNIVDRMKNHKDALNPDDDLTNYKMWAICDLAMRIIYSKITTVDNKEIVLEARIPSMYFKQQSDDFQNTKIYIPIDCEIILNTSGGKKNINNAITTTATTDKGTTSKSADITTTSSTTIIEATTSGNTLVGGGGVGSGSTSNSGEITKRKSTRRRRQNSQNFNNEKDKNNAQTTLKSINENNTSNDEDDGDNDKNRYINNAKSDDDDDDDEDEVINEPPLKRSRSPYSDD